MHSVDKTESNHKRLHVSPRGLMAQCSILAFFMSDEKHKMQDNNEAGYTFRRTNKSMPDREVADSSKRMSKSGTEQFRGSKNFHDRGLV